MIRKIIKIVAIIIMSAIILIVLSYVVIGPVMNNQKVKSDESKLLSVEIPSSIEIVESLDRVTYDYQDHKIVGWIAILLRSDLIYEEIEHYYPNYQVWTVPKPSENLYPNPFDVINFHSFSTLDMNNRYYIVYEKVDVITQIDWRWE